jgi:hypothetical protein
MGAGPNDLGTSRRHLRTALEDLLVHLDLGPAELEGLTPAGAPETEDYPYGRSGVAQRHRRIGGGR